MKFEDKIGIIAIICFMIVLICFIILLQIGMASASIDDIKTATCNSINLTEPNCTTWWDSLNLTDLNFTEIIVEYHTNNYQEVYDYSNKTYYDNDTYVYYNKSYNQSYLDKRYVLQTEINIYAKKSEINNTNTNTIINNTIIESREKTGFSWWNVVSIMEGVLILGLIVFVFLIVREINSGGGEG